MSKNFKYYYSLVTGRVERILEEETNLLEVYQIPLSSKPKSNCSKCYGRCYFSYDSKNLAYIPCNCVKKVVDIELHKNREISFYMPK